MPDKTDKPIFAPLPIRCVTDERLSALDFRVLTAIAAHDRLTANGLGCTAGQARLAQLTGCHPKSLPRTIARLADIGYLTVEPMGRSRRMRVVYNRTDKTIWTQKTIRTGNSTVTFRSPRKHNSPVPIGNATCRLIRQIGNRVSEEQQ